MIVELKRWWHKVGFRFDAHAAILMCEQYGVELSEMDKIPTGEITASWVWNAHKSYCMDNYVRPRYSYKEMKQFIGHTRTWEWNLLLEAMQQTRGPDGKGQKKK